CGPCAHEAECPQERTDCNRDEPDGSSTCHVFLPLDQSRLGPLVGMRDPRLLRDGNPFDIRHIFRGDAAPAQLALALDTWSFDNAAVRLRTPSLAKMFSRCLRTVVGWIHSSRAISALDSPSSTHRITSRSRAVNLCSLEGRSLSSRAEPSRVASTTSV